MNERQPPPEIADLSRLRAFALRVGPIVKAAVELRELGRSLERIEAMMDEPHSLGMPTRSGTPWLIVKQAYDTALEQFDETVKRAALGQFEDLLGGSYEPHRARLISNPISQPGKAESASG